MHRRWPALAALLLSLIFLPLATLPATGQTPLDYPIPNGHFYTQANGKAGEGGTGFSITDNDGVPFWSEYRRLGGPAVLGYPISRRFLWDGFVCQAMQKVVFQWRPEQDAVLFVNVFDKLSESGKDPWLRTVRSVPEQIKLNEEGKSWEEVVRGRLALLDANPAIKQRYFATVGDPIVTNGLPTSRVEDFGNVFVLRAQRVVFQQWKEDVPWAKQGEVQVANGGDVGKEAGIYPAAALIPEPPGSTGGPPVPPAPATSPTATAAAAAPAATATPRPATSPVASPTPASAGSPYPRQIDKQTRMMPAYLRETPGAQWILVKLHQLTACENSGNGIGYLMTLDANGNPIDGVTIRTDSGPTTFTYRTGEKGPGRVEAYFYRGNWTAWVVKDEKGQDTTSDYAVNMDTVLFAQTEEERQSLYCNGQLRNSANHFSYEVVFRKRG
ncbi:MAG: hypothetical protein KatS3mg061_0312 [Dehalococcoidia bacterium]|nr:MAG: hypothetical protein KatS3mg061_0312 [Dehalococcoidia bacterium]